jgi:hypothetical protein
MKMQVNSSETIPAALNNHQAFGSSKPRGEGICLGRFQPEGSREGGYSVVKMHNR